MVLEQTLVPYEGSSTFRGMIRDGPSRSIDIDQLKIERERREGDGGRESGRARERFSLVLLIPFSLSEGDRKRVAEQERGS